MVLIDCARTDSFTLSACLFSIQNVSRVSSSIPSALPLLTFLLRRLSLFSFTKHISRFRLLTSHRQHLSLMASPFLMKFFVFILLPPPCFVVFPEHVDSDFSFEKCSYRSITAVSLQDVLLTSHIPLLSSETKHASRRPSCVIVFVVRVVS